MSEKIYDAYITPNRSTPRQYVRIVCYRRYTDTVRGVDCVSACLFIKDGPEASAEHLPYDRIAPSPTEPEFGRAWTAHVAEQGRSRGTHLTLAQRRA